MGIGDFLGDIGNGIKHGLDKTVEGLNVVDRYINPFHEEQTLTPKGKLEAVKDIQSGHASSRGFLAPGLEDVLSGMRWLYSNGISQPLATTALVGKMNRGNNSFFGGDYFNTSAWTKAWHAANHISPGQAFVMNPEEADHAINSPLLYYKPPEAYLPPGFKNLSDAQQQEVLKDAGMPAVGNAFVEKMRGNSAWFKYGTGALDFGSVTFLDPTVLGFKYANSIHNASVVQRAPKGGWSSEQIDAIMSKSKMTKLMEGLWANKDNPQLINNTVLAQRSGMGPRFGAVLSRLQDPEELNLFIRTGMGDMRAHDELTLRNADAALRMNSDLTRLNGLGLMKAKYANYPNLQTLISKEMDRLSAQRGADADLMQRHDEILAQEGLLDQLHMSRWSLDQAQRVTEAQNAYRAGAGRGAANRPISVQPSLAPLTFTRHDAARGPIRGYATNRIWGAGDYFSGPVDLIRSLKNGHPTGYMHLDMAQSPQQFKDSMVELRGHLARIPNIKDSTRGNILNAYVKATTETERKKILDDVGRLGAAKVAEKHGLTTDVGQALYRKHLDMKGRTLSDMQERYTAALDPERVGASGQPLHLDEFSDGGNKIKVSPFTVTRLMQGHTFQDLDELDTALARHGSRLATLRIATGNARDAVEGWADYGSYLWKFSTLFRLGYVPRILGDDLASQWARVGAAAMALRTTRGVKNAFHNIALWQTRPALAAREQNALNGAEYARDEMGLLQPQIKKMDAFLKADVVNRQNELTRATRLHAASEARVNALSPGDTSAKAAATRTLHGQRQQQLAQAQARANAGTSPGKTQALKNMQDRNDMLQRYHDLQVKAAQGYADEQKKVIQGNQAVTVDGQVFPAAFGGKEGEYYHKLTSSDESVGNIFATNKQLVQGNLERSFNHGAKPISAAQDPDLHLQAWTHAINNQIMQDALSRMAVNGASVDEMTNWLTNDARGMAYRKRLPKFLQNRDIARSAKFEVDQYLHTPEIRMKAKEPEGVNPSFLDQAVPDLVDRPDVHVGQIGASQMEHAKALDRVIGKFYKVAATLPADRMSRHPLFNQFYEGHVARFAKQRAKQLGVRRPNWTVEEVERVAHSARQLALRDMRSLVFDISHRSDAAAALRFLSPFFSATAESFQRWGRVIADKPEVVGYMANWYNAPNYLGAMQDLDGNHIDNRGYTYIPVYPLGADGKPDYSKKPTVIKRQVPKDERYIVTRVPKWVANSPLGKAFNITEAGGQLAISQNSMNMITQGDPWFSPGVGPVVQVPVNEWVKDKPKDAEVARQLGILPYGPNTGNAIQRFTAGVAPKTVRDFMTAFDTSDQRYQQIKMQIMQRAIFEHKELGKKMPTAQEIADKTRNYWLFSASSAFLQPFATTRKDPYQFYRDQYNALRNQNPLTADDNFLKRYGESYFIFAQEISKSSGIPPTMKAVQLAQKYGNLIAKNPELASLIIGPEGNGPFSPEAYAYELNNPLVPGGAEMMRTKMSADQAVKENQRRLGWAKYTAKMNTLNAELRKAGFKSFDDEGAEDFKDQKKAWTSLYAEPLYPDGTVNPYYNAEWSKDFFTLDARKYERMIPGLTAISRSELAKLPERSDLRTLQQYLGGRQALNQQLLQLQKSGQPHTLAAQANSGLRQQWATFVDGLIESDTRFGDLYHRYLSRDMGVDAEEENQ